MLLIEGALAAIEERDRVVAKLHTDPIALVGQSISRMKGLKAEPSWFSPIEQQAQKEHALRLFEPEAAQTFLELIAESKLPGWALESIDLDVVQRAAKSSPPRG